MTKYDFTVSNSSSKTNSITVNRRNGHIHGILAGISFIDKDTNQFVTYIPALDISGYGETRAKAEEMVKASMFDFFIHLIEMNYEKMEAEMKVLGWNKKKFFNKQYSAPIVDIKSALKDFNPDESSINAFTLKAA